MNKEEAKFRAVLKETESIAQEVIDWWESPYSPSDEERKTSEVELKLLGALMQIAVITHNGAMQDEAR